MDEQCIPSNPDISGIGVRTAIYAQNLLCFAPVVVHLWDGYVTDEELRGIKDQTFGMLAIAFAILLSAIIGAKSPDGQTQAVTGFHAAIILELSWMNNTSTWIWFLLFVHRQSKPLEVKLAAEMIKLRPQLYKVMFCLEMLDRRVLVLKLLGEPLGPQERKQYEDCVIYVLHALRWLHVLGHPGLLGQPLVQSEQKLSDLSDRELSELTHRGLRILDDMLKLDLFGHPVDATFQAWFGIIKRYRAGGNYVKHAWHVMARAPVLIVGSIHLSLMAAVGLWLWSDPFRFGEFNISCIPSLIVVGGGVDLSSTPLRIFSLMMYSLLAIPGVNLLLPFSFFLTLHVAYNAFRRHRWDQTIHTGSIIGGLVCLAIINIILLVDIELTLVRNRQFVSLGDNEWGFGQILALLLLVIPVRDFITSWMAINRLRQERQESRREELRRLEEQLAAAWQAHNHD